MLKKNIQVYLASKSPRRAELLRQIGINFECLPVELDESVLEQENPENYAIRLAMQKAQAGLVMATHKHLPVIGSDTCIVYAGEIIGKPTSVQHAKEILRRLSGNWHEVKTSVAVCNEISILSTVQSSKVRMRKLSEEEIANYVDSGEPIDKAGAYAIQGKGAIFIECIEGSYSGIMGLPLFETAKLLREFNINCV